MTKTSMRPMERNILKFTQASVEKFIATHRLAMPMKAKKPAQARLSRDHTGSGRDTCFSIIMRIRLRPKNRGARPSTTANSQ